LNFCELTNVQRETEEAKITNLEIVLDLCSEEKTATARGKRSQ
jgi:hypothetical protein